MERSPRRVQPIQVPRGVWRGPSGSAEVAWPRSASPHGRSACRCPPPEPPGAGPGTCPAAAPVPPAPHLRFAPAVDEGADGVVGAGAAHVEVGPVPGLDQADEVAALPLGRRGKELGRQKGGRERRLGGWHWAWAGTEHGLVVATGWWWPRAGVGHGFGTPWGHGSARGMKPRGELCLLLTHEGSGCAWLAQKGQQDTVTPPSASTHSTPRGCLFQGTT